MVNLSLCCAYFVGMDKAVQEEASQFPNVKVISTDAKGDAAKLTSNVEDLLSQKVDGLIVSGAWIEAAPEALDAIKAAGVPVVMVDRLLKGGDYSSWVGPDNRAIGVGIGEYIAKRLNGKGTIVVIRGGPADNSIGADRTDGMLSVVKKTDIKVETAPDFGGWSVDGGFKQMDRPAHQGAAYRRRLLRERLLCARERRRRSRTRAVASEMFLASVDGEKGTLKEIMTEGTNYGATGQNNSDQIGRAGFYRLMAILAGAEAPQKTVLPSPIITKDNAIKFYNPDSVF